MNAKRRDFVGRLSLSAVAVIGAPLVWRRHAGASTVPAPAEPWLQGLSGRHRQFFDAALASAGAPLGRAASFLDAYGRAYALTDRDLNIVFGAHGSGLALVFTDEIWSTYQLGSYFTLNDPATNAPGVRNFFSGYGDATGTYDPSVRKLQGRGVRFIACMQSMARLSRQLASRDGADPAAINDALLGGLLPSVTPVPAMIVAANRAQESGLTYVYVG